MMSFIIEVKGEVKEAFSYERPLSEASRQALLEYALANYGAAAMLRNMTDGEEADFIQYGELSFKNNSSLFDDRTLDSEPRPESRQTEAKVEKD